MKSPTIKDVTDNILLQVLEGPPKDLDLVISETIKGFHPDLEVTPDLIRFTKSEVLFRVKSFVDPRWIETRCPFK